MSHSSIRDARFRGITASFGQTSVRLHSFYNLVRSMLRSSFRMRGPYLPFLASPGIDLTPGLAAFSG